MWLGAHNRSIRQGASSSNNADYSLSGTVTSTAKSSQAGFIAPVFMYDGTRLLGARVFEVTGPCVVDFYVERVLGATGTISATIATFSSTNVSAGVNYTSTSQVVTFNDGEVGYKKVSIPVLAIPTGFGIVGIEIQGSSSFRRYSYIWLRGSGHVPGAKYLKSLGTGVNSNGNTSGTGTQADPWRSPQYAASQMGSTGGVLYVMDTGGNYKEIATSTVGDCSGAFQFLNKCSVTAPLVVIADPDNSSTPLFDNGLTSGLSNSQGICFDNYATAVWLVGLHVTNGNITTQYSATSHCVDIVIWKCESDNYRINGSNGGALRIDHSSRFIVDNSYFHECYSTEGGNTSNEYTSVASGFHEGIIGFDTDDASIVHCELDLCEFGVFQKDPAADLGTSMDISHCLFKRFQRSSTLPGAPIAYEVAGNGSPALKRAIVRYNVHEGNLETGTQKSNELVMAIIDSAGNQSNFLDIYCNVGRKSLGLVNVSDVDNIRLFNNISEDARGNEIKLKVAQVGNVTKLEYSDYNYYVRSPFNFLTNYGASTVTYSTLSTWRTSYLSDSFVTNAPDVNSQSTSTTPSYTAAGSYDFRWPGAPTGWGGLKIGVGNQVVGRYA